MKDYDHQSSILVTGGAGFIGSHLCEALLSQGHRVTAFDNFDPFYDRKVKEANLRHIQDHPNFKLLELDITDVTALDQHFPEHIDAIVHLAAKAGVRPSILDPLAYQQTNVIGTQNLLEQSRKHGISSFIFGSSSSVYGVNKKVPWKESDRVLEPISPYASTKVSSELLGHVYSHLYGIRFLALRFFTVYGPRQRPDLAIHKFFHKIMQEESIPVYGDGSTYRDYTYVDDIVQGICRALEYDDSEYEVINIGNSETIALSDLIAHIEKICGKKAIIDRLAEQPGDVPKTYADISKARELLNYSPSTHIEEGLQKFYDWYISQDDV